MQFFTPPSLPVGFPSIKPGPQPPRKPAALPVAAKVDEIGMLSPTKLGDVEFPSLSFNEKGSHSLVVHLFPYLNNARVENTGFGPRQWTLIGVLTNNIFPSKSESWGAGTLYPYVWDQLKALLQTTTTQILVHPEVGEVNVKVVDYDYTLHGDKPRDGVMVMMKFIETIGDDQSLQQTNGIDDAPGSLLDGSANALDNAIGKSFNDPRLSPPGTSLQGLFTQIAGYIRNITNFPNMAITSLNAQAIGLSSTIGGAAGSIINVPSTNYDTISSILSLNKQTVAGYAPINNAIQNDTSTFTAQTKYFISPVGPNNNSSTTNFSAGVSSGQSQNINYPQGAASQIVQSYQGPIVYPSQEMGAMLQAYFTMTTTANKGAPAIINKALLFTERLYAYYVALDSYQTAEIQQNLLNFATQLRTITNPANSNRNLASFVNLAPFTWMDAAKQCGNTIDTLCNSILTYPN